MFPSVMRTSAPGRVAQDVPRDMLSGTPERSARGFHHPFVQQVLFYPRPSLQVDGTYWTKHVITCDPRIVPDRPSSHDAIDPQVPGLPRFAVSYHSREVGEGTRVTRAREGRRRLGMPRLGFTRGRFTLAHGPSS